MVLVAAARGGGRAFSRRCGLAVAGRSCESQGGVDTAIGALRARAAVVPPSSNGKMVSN